jgi:hypothetical protein
MYGPGSAGCGGVVSGEQMAARLVYNGLHYNMGEFYAAAPESHAKSIDLATAEWNCACISYPDF